jgi:DNA-nicking Smr family endonuclease
VKSAPDVEDLRLWAVVSSTVRPLKPAHPTPPVPPAKVETAPARPPRPAHRHAHHPGEAKAHPVKGKAHQPPQDVEAGLRHRLARGREALAARIDLHGLDHDGARTALTRFVERSVADGWRAVLVITGKGVSGDGVLRRRVPDWLSEPPLRPHVAGVSEAHRRHGGEGALYVALKRRD